MPITSPKQGQTSKKKRRCPVLKIDLKGRFVNIDDLTAELLGIQAENLFGKSIEEFLDEESYQKLLEIFHSGSRFDTCHESVDLNVIDGNLRELV